MKTWKTLGTKHENNEVEDMNLNVRNMKLEVKDMATWSLKTKDMKFGTQVSKE